MSLDLEAIKARYAAATVGPWETSHTGTLTLEEAGAHLAACLQYSHAARNAEFIAHAHEDVPALVTEVERLTAERDASRADYEGACKLVAQMHAAAIGGKVGDGPRLGVLEDVVAVQRALAAAQADAARLRGVMSQLLGDGHNLKAFAKALLDWGKPGFDMSNEAQHVVSSAEEWHRRIVAALATPAGDEALREFGLRVARAAKLAGLPAYYDDDQLKAKVASIVDAVLRGEP